MDDIFEGYTIKNHDKLWVPYHPKREETSVAGLSDIEKGFSRWDIEFLDNG